MGKKPQATYVYCFVTTKTKLEKIASKHGLSQVQAIEEIVSYFYKSGLSPFQTSGGLEKEIDKILNAVINRADNIIRFIRTQDLNIENIKDKTQLIIDILATSQSMPIKRFEDEGSNKKYILPQVKVAESAVITREDESIYLLKEELKEKTNLLKEIVNKIEMKKNIMGTVITYELNISESMYNELMIKYNN